MARHSHDAEGLAAEDQHLREEVEEADRRLRLIHIVLHQAPMRGD